MSEAPMRWRREDGWLAGVIPARANRFLVHENGVAHTLRASGATLTADGPEVEILNEHRRPSSRAPLVIVTLAREMPTGAHLPVRAVARIKGSILLTLSTARTKRRLKAAGHASPFVLRFDADLRHHPVLRLPGLANGNAGSGLVRRLPLRSIVVARRGEHGPTMLEAAIAEADPGGSPALDQFAPRLGGSGVLLAISPQVVLRVALKCAREQIDRASAILSALHSTASANPVSRLLPDPLGNGELPLAVWALESRVVGTQLRAPVPEMMLEQCVGFLIELFQSARELAGSPSPGRVLSDQAEIVADVCPSEGAAKVRMLARQADERLAGLPRGLAHGDFWHENLLVHSGRLAGVVDWSAGRGEALPLLDLLHLLVNSERMRSRSSLGSSIAQWLLPVVRAGGGPHLQRYCAALGLALHTADLEALVAAYWLNHVGNDLGYYADRAINAWWLEQNVRQVVRALRPLS